MVHKINKENEMQDIKINIMLEIDKKKENKNARHKIKIEKLLYGTILIKIIIS